MQRLRRQPRTAATNTDTMKFKERKINDLQKWRRGWDLYSLPPLTPRKLLNSLAARIAATATVALIGYSFGTHLGGGTESQRDVAA